MRGKQDPFMRDPVAAEMSGLRVGTRSHEHRGVDAGKLGNLDLAMAELEKAVNLDPENTSARTNLGTAYALAGRLDDAMEQYQAAVALDPEDRRAQCNFGVILAKLGRNEEARIRFGEALKLDSDYCDAHVGFAAVSAILGDYAEAEEHFRMAWDMDPENRAAILGLAKALSKQGRDKDALDVLMRGRQVHPQSLILANALARLQSASAEESVRDGASALRLADAVVKVNPSPEHMETLAMALAESGNFVDAARIQERAVEMWKESSSREGGEGVDEERGEGLDGARIRLEKYQKSEFCRDPAFRFEQFDGAIEPGKQ
jgi:tetratricopeptide (TPR) repeat protein